MEILGFLHFMLEDISATHRIIKQNSEEIYLYDYFLINIIN